MIRFLLGLGFLVIFVPSLFAQHNGVMSLRQTMTSYVQYDLSTNTYESDTAQNKETAESSSVTFATSAGSQKLIHIALRSSRSHVKFALNGNTMYNHFRDILIGYRLGWFSPALTATLTEIQVTKTNQEYIDIYRASLGAGISMMIPLMDRMVAYGDVRFYQEPEIPRFNNILASADAVPDRSPRQLEASMGGRSEMDIGASIDVAREVLDFVVGYRVKSYNLLVEGEEQNEYQGGIYAGFKIGAYF